MKKHHYVYRITNTQMNKHYYGVRSSKVEPKLDLGIKYFSSSTDKEFIQEQKENKDIFKYKIIKLFNSRKEANNFEIYIHEKFNVGINESFYNRAKSTSTGFCIEGINHSEETKSKISGTQKGGILSNETKAKMCKPKSEETKFKISETKKGTKHTAETKAKMSESKKNMSNETRAKMSKAKQNVSDETKAKLSKSNKDKPKSEEHKAKMSETAKNRTKIKCPYCEKESHISIMTRWHFDNCKLKKDI